MKELKIGVLGATGAVGQEMLKILAEYDIPVSELRPLASARSAGSLIKFKGKDVAIRAASDESFEGLDFVLGAVEGDMSRRFAPAPLRPRDQKKRRRVHRQQLRFPARPGGAARRAGDQRRRRLRE